MYFTSNKTKCSISPRTVISTNDIERAAAQNDNYENNTFLAFLIDYLADSLEDNCCNLLYKIKQYMPFVLSLGNNFYWTNFLIY